MGNLDERGIGDVTTMTVGEYLSRGRWQRLWYRIYRHPAMLFGVGPTYLFLLQHRLPIGLMRKGWQPWISTMATNLAIAVIAVGVMWLLGVEAFLLIQLPTAMLAASIGVWLFYVQHQFERTYWEEEGAWTHAESSLHGSSHYVLPGVPALADGEYRDAPCAPPQQPHPVLPAAGGAQGLPRTRRGGTADALAELQVRAPDALGRAPQAARLLPGHAAGRAGGLRRVAKGMRRGRSYGGGSGAFPRRRIVVGCLPRVEVTKVS